MLKNTNFTKTSAIFSLSRTLNFQVGKISSFKSISQKIKPGLKHLVNQRHRDSSGEPVDVGGSLSFFLKDQGRANSGHNPTNDDDHDGKHYWEKWV